MDNKLAMLIFIPAFWLIMAVIVPVIKVKLDSEYEDIVEIKSLWEHGMIGMFWPITGTVLLIRLIGVAAREVSDHLRFRRFFESGCRIEFKENEKFVKPADKKQDKDQSSESI